MYNLPSMTQDKQIDKAVEAAIKLLEKRFGPGALMKLGSKQKINVDIVPTGALSLDLALGIGGLPRGRVIEIFGPEASGKTTLALHVIAEAQKQGLKVAFIDAEHALDPQYAQRIGVDIKNLYVSQPDFGEQALEIVETLTRSGAFGVIVIDSVAALVPRAEVEGDMGDIHMGLQARLMSQALRKITPIAGKTNTMIIFLNQIRMDLGVKYGNPETTTGGRALKFYSSIRLDIRRRDALKDSKGEIIGHRREVKVVKNKLAPPFRTAFFNIYFATGIDKLSSIVEAAIKVGVIQVKGSWYTYKGNNLAQGLQNTIALLKEDQKLAQEIETSVREFLK